MTDRAFEDFHPSEIVTLGSRSIGETEITAFARDYDRSRTSGCQDLVVSLRPRAKF
jgi:hypothetical protein